jgi:FlaA1/EpsC-like NDP-sugar epimerase
MKELLNNKRSLIKISLDILSIMIGVILALIIKYEYGWINRYDFNYFLIYSIFYSFFYLATKEFLKSWGYTNSLDVLRLLGINIGAYIGSVAYFALIKHGFSRSVITLSFIIAVFIQLGMRFLFRLNRSYKSILIKKKGRKETIIYGAGEGGVTLIRESITNPNFPYNIIGLIDDDEKKTETYINGAKVLGNFNDFEEILKRLQPENVIIAIPSINKEKIKQIVKVVKKFEKIGIEILPGIDELLLKGTLSSQIRNVDVEDLLGRDQVLVNGDSIKQIIKNKTIFVTGGAGSIGSELVRQIAKYNPKQLIAIDVNENALYFLELELKRIFPMLKIITEICNIREEEKVDYLFKKYNPEIVFHAAAHKHVPLMEHNPEEAIKNNIFGTKNLAEAADKYQVERFVLISTDKAVNPTNIMGATKRACELVIEDINKQSNTKFMAVRFGNVLGSNGSVIPIFKKLIEEGKNLTLTHPEITRYFMTIPEAAQLVIEAGALGSGGEVFILDMGEPIKIMDLAKTMIELSNADVDIEIVGLRPGEKLYEELLYDVNSAIKTENKKIFITKLTDESHDIGYHLERLKKAVKNPNIEEIKELMKKFIISYREPEHHKKEGEKNENNRIISTES